MRIFVIDDHPLMREAVVMLIRRLHAKAIVTELDRLAAIGPAVEQHGIPDIICLDLKLPDTHGVSGVRELRQQFPEVPIVVLSAAPAQDYQDLSLEAGADVYIEKSVGATEIAKVLSSPDLRKRAEDAGTLVEHMTPAQLGDYTRKELAYWGRVIQEGKITAD